MHDHPADFDYALPVELIAQRPLAERSASRLLRLELGDGHCSDLAIRDLPGQLSAGDLLVFNDTRVVPARLFLHKLTGGRIEALLERPLPERRALMQLRDSKRLRVGQTLRSDGGELLIVARHGELWELALPDEALPFFERFGTVPLPPYIERGADASDRERYQSVLARVPGAVAAPTASLHFDAGLLAEIDAASIERATVTLHVGAGTFQPLRGDDLAAQRLHAERYTVPEQTVQAVARVRAAGRRVVAVGTTVARALESAALSGALLAGTGETALFVRPGFQFKVIDALLTNLHLPRSTLLMLVCALAGRERVLAAYRHAVEQRYRFFSYGDAMLLLRR